ncbi:MAG TPA: DUF4239 domain-containing protein [Steroidobacteraceae bacterium]|jgi:hypothetical protein
MISLLSSLPLWMVAVILNVWMIGFSLICLWLLGRWVLPKLQIGHDDALFYAAAVMQSAMVLYGLVAALTAVNVWTRHGQAAQTVSREATSIAILWRQLDGYPPDARDAMHAMLRGYTEQIIGPAWSAQRAGRVPTEGVELMNRFQQRLFVFEPSTEAQKIVHGATLAAYDRLIEARRERLDAVKAALPQAMWWVLLPGAMGCLLLSVFFPVKDVRFHAILVTALSGFIAMVLFVIVTLDYPFQGPMAIGADSYQLVHDQLMGRSADVDGRLSN